MIDCENEVYTRVKKYINEVLPTLKINTSTEYQRTPSKFPFVSIEMTDNYTWKRGQTNALEENYSVCVFQIDIYSNKTGTKKSECKKILHEVDNIMQKMNFTRESSVPMPNLENASIYRITSRYEAITDGIYFYRKG